MEQEKEISSSESISAHQDLYKYNSIFENQNHRRKQLLIELKRRRNFQIDQYRGIEEAFNFQSNEPTEKEEPVDAIEYRKPQTQHFGKDLMLSEWMFQVPMDFEEDWLFKICPTGVRNIVVAHKGVTKVFNKRSQRKATFQSNLPGGSRHGKYAALTLLDCIYNCKEKTYYVLDIIHWNSTLCTEWSAELRFFFLKNKFLDFPELFTSDGCKFVYVDCHEALLSIIETHLEKPHVINDVEVAVDGILFYHKEFIYDCSKVSPMVSWLKPYMIPEKLKIPVHGSYSAERPPNYLNFHAYMKEIENKNKKGKVKKVQEIDMGLAPNEESGVMDVQEQYWWNSSSQSIL